MYLVEDVIENEVGYTHSFPTVGFHDARRENRQRAGVRTVTSAANPARWLGSKNRYDKLQDFTA
jgi:hypothetical protein